MHTIELAENTTNQLLDALPVAARDEWFASLTPSFLEIKTVLFEPGQIIEHVYFPLNGVISLVTPLEDGAIVEVATVGNEGIVGVPLVVGGSLAVRAISQVPGWVLRMEATAFDEAIQAEPAVRRILSDYLQALFGQVAQAAACNRLHSNEERLSRWLLMTRDRVGVDEFTITHEFLGQMLGSRRATVTLSAGILQAAGLIKYRRGVITIVDRPGLESVSCECYGVIKSELDSVIDKAERRGRLPAHPRTQSRATPARKGRRQPAAPPPTRASARD
ncbi:MAG: Crp/Fnr family transcriptional regulator [Candidatus Dormibacteraeota bacterium]|uniref:Crp/Fnr family transcriptional regulator n=1 Tax=Candidatus Amunia macphersoniae TaxID=3127014 RepID=A0A934NF02_9BACT|nr:Crp/Fnr family transcriptional regulator [Candidatus Dormibacteraeota bacterium]